MTEALEDDGDAGLRRRAKAECAKATFLPSFQDHLRLPAVLVS